MKVSRRVNLLLPAIIFFGLSIFLNSKTKKPVLVVNKQDSALNFSDEFLRFGFAGYHRLIADVLWISTLLESDLGHYKKRDLNSWMYLRFKSISKLDPKFYQNYAFGAQYLSIIKDDLIGARDLFEKGLKYYPENYNLIFNAAFLYAFELGDDERAIELYNQLLKFPQRPKYVESLIAKLQFRRTGDLSTAYELLQEMYKNEEKEGLIKQKLFRDLYAIKATLDLNCLNSGKDDCEKKDFLGDRYIFKNGKFTTQNPFTPYELHDRRNKVKKKGDQ